MKIPWNARPILLGALMLSIPAFYLVLTTDTPYYRSIGQMLYAMTALLMAADFAAIGGVRRLRRLGAMSKLDVAIFMGALASIWATSASWSTVEWLLRLGYCALVFIRLMSLLGRYLMPYKLVVMLGIAGISVAIAGGGFYWLEPKVHSYADGVWLAFVTGATVGYGDMVPSTPASRIFAVFIVLLGYALFSLVTARIAALLVGEDEKRLSREMHADMRELRKEIASLRQDLKEAVARRGTLLSASQNFPEIVEICEE